MSEAGGKVEKRRKRKKREKEREEEGKMRKEKAGRGERSGLDLGQWKPSTPKALLSFSIACPQLLPHTQQESRK